ncbi:uncharacterized protein LOC125652092 isoform X3 [Ostrea edulis]|nr:uncharacterized protein LOC125652092 isoform X3 [Ostrea edulis]
MDQTSHKTETFRVLKQMSIRRHDLEKSSDKLRSHLEHLQQINDEHGERISSSLEALRQQQERTDELLNSEKWRVRREEIHTPNRHDRGRGDMSSRPLQREPSILRQLKTWSTSDLIQWLEQKRLNKFIFLFQKHHVTGADLADLKLAFLEKYEHISVSDREELLSQVYELLRLEQSDDSDSTRTFTPFDKEKYRVAKQIADDYTFQRSQSVPVAFIPSQSSSSSSSSSVSSTASSPTPKQRRKSSETISLLSHLKPKVALSTKGQEVRQNTDIRKGSLDKKKAQKLTPSSWFEALEGSSNPCVSCYTLQKRGGHFGVTIATNPNGWLVINDVCPDLQSVVRTDDRVLEINGCSCLSSKSSCVADIMKSSDVLRIVTCKPMEYKGPHEVFSNGKSPTEVKWQKFRNFLMDYRDQDVDIEQMLKDIPKVEVQKCQEKTALKMELDEALTRVREQQSVIDRLTEEVEDQKALIEDLSKEMDCGVRAGPRGQGNERRMKQGETEYYKITMESLNMEAASKPSEENYWCVCIPSVREQIMMTLKDIVKEASRQKFYLDRLISLVIQESPWLLDQVDANFDDTSIDNKLEEFC